MDTTDSGKLGGQKLIETLVTLSGLPEEHAYSEVGQILDMSGISAEQSQQMTIDQLRQAMLAYLESIDAGMCFVEEPSLESPTGLETPSQ